MNESVYLTFHDGISSESANRFMLITSQALQQYNPQNIYFLFSSGGGSVDSGVTLYHYLRALPVNVIMHNIGSIDSISNAVFLAGNERYATPNSAFLFHGVTWGFGQGANLTYPQMQETLGRFDAAEQLFAGIICERTSFDAKEVRELFRQGQSKDPEFALSKGVIKDIKEAMIIPGSPVLSIASQMR